MSWLPTTALIDGAGAAPVDMTQYRVIVVRGPDRGATAESVDGRMTVGTAETATLRLADPTVSRFHLELEAVGTGIVVRDLESTNGTLVGALNVREIVVRDAVEIDLGRTRIQIQVRAERAKAPATSAVSFGELIGQSVPMRALYSVLERAAPTNAPVLLLGESGTGKELAARAIHAASPRAGQTFEVVDCGGLPPTLIESELFGHERGAFTGAAGEREGAFERADHGTLFLDELGELPLELQPKLLRLLAEGQVRRLGGKRVQTVDVRVVAATNRDLRREVNRGAFRADLYYRLAVIPVRVPALRERLDDLAVLVPALLERIRRERAISHTVAVDAPLLATLGAHTWPGNVRELRNYLEQLVILEAPPPLDSGAPGDGRSPGMDFAALEQMPMARAKAAVIERFERGYVEALLAKTDGHVANAARIAGVDRGTFFRVIRRYGLRSNTNDET